MTKITPKQISKIHTTAKKELGLSEEQLYNVVWNTVKSESISKLSSAQGYEVIKALLNYNSSGEKNLDGRIGMASQAQLNYIDDLVKKLKWDSEPKRLRAFIKKFAKVEDKRFLKKRQASNIIEGLKKILERSKQTAAAE